MIYGATGYTGRMAAEHARRRAPPPHRGRARHRTAGTSGSRIGLRHRAFRLQDIPAVENVVSDVSVDGAYDEAQRLGYEIVHPITTEPWGVRRFFVRAPDGNVINVVRHRD